VEIMHIKRIHDMIEKLTKCAEMEFEKGVENVDTKEMGEVVDIIKDLAEAEYYAKISKAMDESEYGEDYDYKGAYDEHSRKGYRGQPRDSKGRYMSGRRGYDEPMGDYEMTPDMYRMYSPEYYRDMDRMDGKMYYTSGGNSSSGMSSQSGSMGSNSMTRDSREGRSGQSRKSYMETKEMHKGNTPEDKEAKKKELDKWMTDIGSDIKELVHDMSSEEKTVAKQKLTNLANSLV
jgi:hypothetical protein